MASLLFINISFAANTGKVIVETAKLREQANTDSKVLELASQGDEVEILSEENEWYKIKYKNITGYLRKDLVQLNNETTETVKERQSGEAERPAAVPGGEIPVQNDFSCPGLLIQCLS